MRATPHAGAKAASLTRSETVARTPSRSAPVCRGLGVIPPHGTNLAPCWYPPAVTAAILRRFPHMAFT
ncbi:hypothetical protein CBM2615_B10068 [Cupriavidus taiwanensis]|uniref:Uncharacterized protein n=1 Tax=Cupriavidus taiwanensis TaxID=164546 RepID=A0A976AZ48_9BURK|nr:hypothetical protein CBM2615_B10068 [Cupriavidus taiwanensis]SOZ66021.1 hypothetical protein CBM2613_B10068 [Cupriavidus taiwanensis]SOZ67590.1 hypothetical protein CBM2614_B220068 [Cupriavidus taiwanensis]SPA07373.1 hypothetical protein CBM2625_B10068 [Cupriavidus taiwanensis]